MLAVDWAGSHRVNTIPKIGCPPRKHAAEKGFTFPYLFDETQRIACKFAAEYTPEFFVLTSKRKVVYMGRAGRSRRSSWRRGTFWRRCGCTCRQEAEDGGNTRAGLQDPVREEEGQVDRNRAACSDIRSSGGCRQLART